VIGVEELRRHVFVVASHFLGHHDDSEEVTQEALLRLVQARSDGTPVKNERAFVTQTAVRLAIDRIRATRTRGARLPDIARHRCAVVQSRDAPPDVQRLYDALATLPPRQAAVVTLRKLMELEYADVAALLGISVENCRSHCRHGLRKLRELLRESSPKELEAQR
jgi:RNA polymerase sigma-70 factor (ECF subfamily)